MSGETWTEYAVIDTRYGIGDGSRFGSVDKAREFAAAVGGTVVGRTVTASPWLPVQEQA